MISLVKKILSVTFYCGKQNQSTFLELWQPYWTFYLYSYSTFLTLPVAGLKSQNELEIDRHTGLLEKEIRRKYGSTDWKQILQSMSMVTLNGNYTQNRSISADGKTNGSATGSETFLSKTSKRDVKLKPIKWAKKRRKKFSYFSHK